MFSNIDMSVKNKFDRQGKWIEHHSLYPTVALFRAFSEFPDPKFLESLRIKLSAAYGPLEHLLDYGGARFLFVLNYNENAKDCVENEHLREVYNAFSQSSYKNNGSFDIFWDPNSSDEPLFRSSRKCMELFWPFLQAHVAVRFPSERDLLVRDTAKMTKMQVQTKNGKVCSTEYVLDYEVVPGRLKFSVELSNPSESAYRSFPNDLDPRLFSPLVVRLANARGSFKFLLDYNGVRYLLLLKYNSNEVECAENACLSEIYDGYERKDSNSMFQGCSKCLELFWPFLKEHANRRECERAPPISAKKAIVNIQLRTVNGVLCEEEHNERFSYQDSPIDNPFPDLPTFPKVELEEMSKLHGEKVLHVKIGENEYCVKPLYRTHDGHFLREIQTLRNLPSHSNLIPLLGLVDAGAGKVDGIVLPYIPSISLQELPWITMSQGEKWKTQIEGTVNFLHSNNIVWGDVKPANVLVDKRTNDAILIDFGGGRTHPWIDPGLEGTKEGDIQGLERILAFIDEKVAGKSSSHAT